MRPTELTARLQRGDPHAWADAEALSGSGNSTGEARRLARAAGKIAEAASWLGRYEFAEQQLCRAERLAEQSQLYAVRAEVAATRLRLDWYAGRWHELAERSRKVGAELAHLPAAAAEAGLVQGLALAAQGNPDEADGSLAAVLSCADAELPVWASAAAAAGALLLARQELAAAGELADRGLAAVRRERNWLWAAEFAPVAVRTYAALGRLSQAEAVTADLARATAGRAAPAAAAAYAACQGWLADARGAARTAAAAFSLATRRYRALPTPYAAAACQAAAGHRWLAADHAAGRRILLGALTCLDRLGASAEAARCRQTMRAYGISPATRRGRKGYGAALSPREREVAALVARGATNRQIAAALFLSERTVEDHVSHIIGKLRVSSRREIRRLD